MGQHSRHWDKKVIKSDYVSLCLSAVRQVAVMR